MKTYVIIALLIILAFTIYFSLKYLNVMVGPLIIPRADPGPKPRNKPPDGGPFPVRKNYKVINNNNLLTFGQSVNFTAGSDIATNPNKYVWHFTDSFENSVKYLRPVKITYTGSDGIQYKLITTSVGSKVLAKPLQYLLEAALYQIKYSSSNSKLYNIKQIGSENNWLGVNADNDLIITDSPNTAFTFVEFVY
jgi:hypothetical protein